MSATIEIVIIGAGPYGLSMAAHLHGAGVPFRIFGSAMNTWLTQMPKGACLKSEGFASNLFEPTGQFTLATYCAQNNLPYADVGLPVPLATFSAFGLAFQKRFVPQLEDREVVSLRKTGGLFRLTLDTGETVLARRVIVAVGISHYQNVPSVLACLPDTHVSHSSRHNDLSRFAGKAVTVVGAGASALDCAALLRQAGAAVTVVARKKRVWFHAPPPKQPRTLRQRMAAPMTGLGPGWRSWLCTEAPLVFYRMPQRFRHMIVKRHLGPAPVWWIRDQVEGKIPMHMGVQLRHAAVQDGKVHLDVAAEDGTTTTIVSDHVIAGTGYKVALRKLAFLDPTLREAMRHEDETPVLSPDFESSAPGLYFVGATSANMFGPLVRFAYGARFTARRLSRHLSRAARRDRNLAVGADVDVPVRAPVDQRPALVDA